MKCGCGLGHILWDSNEVMFEDEDVIVNASGKCNNCQTHFQAVAVGGLEIVDPGKKVKATLKGTGEVMTGTVLGVMTNLQQLLENMDEVGPILIEEVIE